MADSGSIPRLLESPVTMRELHAFASNSSMAEIANVFKRVETVCLRDLSNACLGRESWDSDGQCLQIVKSLLKGLYYQS